MIKLNNVSKSFDKNKKNENKVLKNLSAEFPDGTITAITGKSGIGKSTLLKIIACLLPMDCGEYDFFSKRINYSNQKSLAQIRNQDIGIVMQEYNLIPDYTVLENITLPLYFGKNSLSEGRKKAIKLLNDVGLQNFENKKVRFLSGGQKQRVAICRALLNNPKLIIAHEPTGSLDKKNTTEIIELLKKQLAPDRIIIIVTHDPDVAKSCNKVFQLDETGLTEIINQS